MSQAHNQTTAKFYQQNLKLLFGFLPYLSEWYKRILKPYNYIERIEPFILAKSMIWWTFMGLTSRLKIRHGCSRTTGTNKKQVTSSFFLIWSTCLCYPATRMVHVNLIHDGQRNTFLVNAILCFTINVRLFEFLAGFEKHSKRQFFPEFKLVLERKV